MYGASMWQVKTLGSVFLLLLIWMVVSVGGVQGYACEPCWKCSGSALGKPTIKVSHHELGVLGRVLSKQVIVHVLLHDSVLGFQEQRRAGLFAGP